MSIHIRLTDAELRGWVAEFPEAVRKALDMAIPQIEAITRSLTPVDTGELAESVEVTKESYGLRVRWAAKYAKFVERGADPHAIEPKRAQALRFLGRDGRWVFAKHVDHPGYPGWYFVQRVRELVMVIVKAAVEFQVQNMLRGR